MESKDLRVEDVFKTLNQRIRDYQYQPRDEERRELSTCFLWKFLAEGVGGGLGGLGIYTATMINPLRKLKALRLGLAVGGTVYGSTVLKQKADLRCLHRLTRLPTPLGGEVEAIIRELDPNHSVIRPGIGDNALPPRLEGDPHARIASVEARMAQATGDPHMATSPRPKQGQQEVTDEDPSARALLRTMVNTIESNSAGIHIPNRNGGSSSPTGTFQGSSGDIFDDSFFGSDDLPMPVGPVLPSKDEQTGGRQKGRRGRRREKRSASTDHDPEKRND